MTLSQITNDLSVTQRERTNLLAQLEAYQNIENVFLGYERPDSINELAVLAVALTEESGLELEQFQPQEPRTIDEQLVYPITVRITAEFSKLSAWLDQIHERMPDIHIMAISIRSLNAESTTITTDIRINWYSPNQS
ncbi:MAG: type 4a pilus biogenesis protein PilO [Phycisphaerales bacterium]